MSRHAAEKRGRRGEGLAAWFLRLKGYRILDRNVRTPRGEVDIVARKGGCLVFVEVKTRDTDAELDLALDEHRLARVAAAAEALIARYARENEDIRIDALLLAPGRLPRHLTNVWMAFSRSG